MFLKSDGFASDLFDPARALTLEAFCAGEGLPYDPTNRPVPVETFTAYGEAFQRRFAPALEEDMVTRVTPIDGGFELRLEDGRTALARQVVVASGISDFGHIPADLAALPADLVSHSSTYGDVSALDGRDVLVIGGGSSAIDIAAQLHGRAASVRVVARAERLRFHSAPRARTLADAVLRPKTGLGPGWKSYFCVHAPLVFHAMPEDFRLDVVRRHLGPAPGWFMRDQIEGRVPCLTGARIVEAAEEGGKARLVAEHSGGAREALSADHIVAATGYRIDLGRLAFLGEELRKRLRLTGTSPALSPWFESSVPGLYFVGASAAASFGPLLRFAYGAGFAARRLTKRLARPGL